mgnify:CR=1 FL=1
MSRLITILLILIGNYSSAQDQIALDALNKLSEVHKSYKNITIDFDFFLENKTQKIKEHQSGNLVLEGEKFQLKMENQTIINNGETQWIYLADMNEVQIMPYDPEEDIMHPKKIFTIYEEDYKYTYVGSKLEKGKYLQIISLFPKESREFMKIDIAYDESKSQLKRIIMYDKNGGTYTYVIKSFKSNTSIEEFIFNIEEFTDIEVIDLR